jgi:hypothetical protein
MRDRSLWFVLTCLVIVSAGCDERTASQSQAATTTIGGCLEDVSGQLNCSSNDVRIARVSDITDEAGNPVPSCTANTDVTLSATLELLNGANSTRPDVGLYIGFNGSARTGTCSQSVIPTTPTEGDGDACGDLGPHQSTQVRIAFTVRCTDADNDGLLDLPNCTAWRAPGSNEVCDGAPVPAGGPSKCRCDSINIGVQVVPGAITLTKVPRVASLPQPGGQFTYDLVASNPSPTAVTLESLCDDQYGTVATTTTCPVGAFGVVDSTDCSLPQAIAPGGTYACSFTSTFAPCVVSSLTDVVTAAGHDANGGEVGTAATATVSVVDLCISP